MDDAFENSVFIKSIARFYNMRSVAFFCSLCFFMSGMVHESAAGSMPPKSSDTTYPRGSLFPLQVYEVEPGDAARLAVYGWNIFQSYQSGGAGNSGKYLAALAAENLDGVAAIPCDGKATNKIAWSRSKVSAWVRELAVNRNLEWWDLPEEARPWSVRELKLLADYTAATRKNDPLRRPTYEYTPNNRNADEISRIVPNIDIVGLSCYCEEMEMPHAWVRYKIEQAGLTGIRLAGARTGRDFLHGEKTPVAILYCAKFAGNGLMPTPEQTYHDFWSAIVSGAQGIGVYAYHHAMKDDPALRQNFQKLNEAASQVSGPEKIGEMILWGIDHTNVKVEILSGPEKTVSFRAPREKTDTQYPSIHLMAKGRHGNLYLIGVNSTDQSVSVRFTIPDSTNTVASLLFENRVLPAKEGTFTDSFAPWGVHIYKL